LALGAIDRKTASDWASPWFGLVYGFADDPAVYWAISMLAGADLTISATEFLHDHEDFVAWLNEYNEKCKMD